LLRWQTKPMQARTWSLRDRMGKIKLTKSDSSTVWLKGDQSGTARFRCYFPVRTPGSERERFRLDGKKKKPNYPYLGNLSAFRPRLAGGWLGLGHALRFGLGLRQEGRVVREVLKIGMDQQPCGLNQLRNWLGQHSDPVNKRKTGRCIPGNPAI